MQYKLQFNRTSGRFKSEAMVDDGDFFSEQSSRDKLGKFLLFRLFYLIVSEIGQIWNDSKKTRKQNRNYERRTIRELKKINK